MKKITFILSFLLFSLVMSAQQLYVASYNIRYNNPDDVAEGNGWNNRCPVICDMINFEQPQIFGAQEVLHNQLVDLLKGLDGYDYIGVGRDDGKEAGEYSAIFYKKDRFKLLDSGYFWLSETPDKPSFGWDAACIRICTWGKFRDNETKFTFYFFNLHMDYLGVKARHEGAKLVISKMKDIAKDAPVIMTGDFNVDQESDAYKTFAASGLLKDCYEAAQQKFAVTGTFNDFGQDNPGPSRIDHVFVSPKFTVEHYGILTNSYWLGKTRRNPSDHYPVFVKLNYQK